MKKLPKPSLSVPLVEFDGFCRRGAWIDGTPLTANSGPSRHGHFWMSASRVPHIALDAFPHYYKHTPLSTATSGRCVLLMWRLMLLPTTISTPLSWPLLDLAHGVQIVTPILPPTITTTPLSMVTFGRFALRVDRDSMLLPS